MFAYCGNNPVRREDAFGFCYYASGIWTHDAWENYGGYEKKPDPQAIDITEKLNAAMAEHAAELIDCAWQYSLPAALALFIDNVRTGGEWDFKNQSDWGLDPNKSYRYKNLLLKHDDIGNIHYGFVGRVLFDKNTLLVAGGIVQIFGGTSSWDFINSNFDDPRDQWAISCGALIWDTGGVEK